MALKSNKTAMSVAIQPTRDTYEVPNSTTDLLPGLSNLRIQQDGVTIADDTYTGSIFRNADQIAGKRVTITGTLKIKPLAALPAANAYVPGRIFQSAKFSELRNATTIPSGGAEALGVGVDSKTATLGSTASTTASIYKGYPIKIGAGAYKDAMTAIRSYDASKHAVLMEDWGSTPTGNYIIPTFLMYTRDVTDADPAILSSKIWIDGVLYELYNIAVTGLRMQVPTSTKQQAQYPTFEFTMDATIYDIDEEATPTIGALGAVPLFKDGKDILNYVEFGASNLSIDFGLQSESPPNGNQVDGNDAPELTGGTATASLTMQKYRPSSGLDTQALADAQTYHPFFRQWGNAAGNLVQITIPDARLNFPNPDLSGATANENVDLFIDVLSRNMNLTFTY